jgi:methyl-accepting chemotaxis protein
MPPASPAPSPTMYSPHTRKARNSWSSCVLVAALLALPTGCGVFDDNPHPTQRQGELGEAGTQTRPTPRPVRDDGEPTVTNKGDASATEISADAPAQNDQKTPVPVDAAAQQALIQSPASGERAKLTTKQVQTRLRSFADQYRNEIAAACDEIKNRREDPLLRRRAHRYKVDGATAVYDIAVEDNPRQAVLDMLVLVTLQWYVAETHGETQFPEDHPLIKEKTRIIKDSAWGLASRVMTEKQRADLLAVIDRWWTDNGQRTEIWYVRITDFAGYGKGTSFEGVFSGVTNLPGKFLNVFVPIDDATDTLNDATLIAERTTWLAPRLMILAQWRAESIVLDALATTEVTRTLNSVNDAVAVADRATGVAERLPDQIGEQREALISDLTENEESLKALLAETRSTIESIQGVTGDANEIVTGGQELLRVTDETLKTADQVVKSVESMIATAKEGGDENPEDAEPGKPFDITEYTEAVRAAELTLKEINTVLTNLETASRPDELTRRVEPVLDLSEDFIDDTLARVERLVIVAAIALAAAGIAIVGFAKFVPSRGRAKAGS